MKPLISILQRLLAALVTLDRRTSLQETQHLSRK
jgi:hypothetical protein